MEAKTESTNLIYSYFETFNTYATTFHEMQLKVFNFTL